MGSLPRLLGGVSIVLAPLVAGVSDQLRMAAEPASTIGAVDSDYGLQSVQANLESIANNQSLFVISGALAYAAALLMVPALLAIWRLSVDRSRRWAWAGAVIAALGVAGQLVHIAAYHGMTLAALRHDDRAAAAQFILDAETTPFVLAIFAPFFLALLAAVPQAVGLRRAQVIPLWACLTIVAATVFFMFVGSTPWTSAAWTILLVAGFAPAAAAMLGSQRQPTTHPAPDAAVAART